MLHPPAEPLNKCRDNTLGINLLAHAQIFMYNNNIKETYEKQR